MQPLTKRTLGTLATVLGILAVLTGGIAWLTTMHNDTHANTKRLDEIGPVIMEMRTDIIEIKSDVKAIRAFPPYAYPTEPKLQNPQ